jgi:hypothetical protein
MLCERDRGRGALATTPAKPSCTAMMVDQNSGNRPAFSKRMVGLGFELDDQPLRSLTHDTEKYSGHLLRYKR